MEKPHFLLRQDTGGAGSWQDPAGSTEFLTPKGKKKRHPKPNVQEQQMRVYQQDAELVNVTHPTEKPPESEFLKSKEKKKKWWEE